MKKRLITNFMLILALAGAITFEAPNIPYGEVVVSDISETQKSEVTASEQPTEKPEESEKPTPEPKPVVELTKKEKSMLVRLAMAEAEDQGVKGKALVMNVVYNRVKDSGSDFEDTIKDVIYQENQFAVIANGRYDRVTPDEECYKALSMFMNGWDGSQGALYFESKSESTWHADNLKYLFKHKGHYFYTKRE